MNEAMSPVAKANIFLAGFIVGGLICVPLSLHWADCGPSSQQGGLDHPIPLQTDELRAPPPSADIAQETEDASQ